MNIEVTDNREACAQYAAQQGVPIPPRALLLQEAEKLITGDRNKTYGTPTQNFQNIADLWNVQFGHLLKDGVKLNGAHVAQALCHVKLARMVAQPKRDNFVDLAGYAACGWEAQADVDAAS